MGVIDGSPVNASNTNAAFLDATEDDTGFGIYTLANTDVSSGPTVTNIQRALNRLFDGTGIDNNTVSGTDYNAPTGTIDNGDSHFTALSKLADLFAGVTGHIHDGTDGNGPVVQIATATSGMQGQVSLSTTTPQPVADTPSYGTPSGIVSNEDHVHEGLHSIGVSGLTPLLGDVEIQFMGSVTGYHSGNNIVISGNNSGGGSSSGVSVLDWLPSPNGPPEELPLDINGLMPYWDFTSETVGAGEYATKELIGIVRVPDDYVSGTQIFLKGLMINIPSAATGNILMGAHTSFWETFSSINVGSPEYDSTNSQLSLPIGAGESVINITGIDLTDVSGQIDSTTILPGNILRIRLGRSYSSESAPTTGSVYVFRNTSYGSFS